WNVVASSLGQTLAKMEGPGRRLTADMISSARSPIAADVSRLAPHLRNKGLHWHDFPRFIALRDELFELDLRFAQLGPQSLFAAIEAQGVLRHQVDGVGDIAGAIVQAPPDSRAALRGRFIRELSGAGERYVADWSGIFDCQARCCVDLGDPFAESADWGPWRTRQFQRMQITLGLYQGIDLD
ncbi:MAG TPA: proteasome accessory factor PafA2 family protein, partial [Candidatus Acidoferrales bacterium]|nr:proteasome accessory factor PafA2 family protein [Candidatus Acidoferrales bacterium]